MKGGGGSPNLAALTGGVNFAKRNDLDIGVRDAIEDGDGPDVVYLEDAMAFLPVGFRLLLVTEKAEHGDADIRQGREGVQKGVMSLGSFRVEFVEGAGGVEANADIRLKRQEAVDPASS